MAVKLKRSGYDGPVRIDFVCPGNSTVHAGPITIGSKMDTGVLKLTANGDAAKAVLANSVIRAEFDQGGKFVIDGPVKVQVLE